MISGTTFALQNTAYSTNALLRNTITTIIQLSIGIYTEGVENANGLSSSGLGTGVKRGMIFFLRQIQICRRQEPRSDDQ